MWTQFCRWKSPDDVFQGCFIAPTLVLILYRKNFSGPVWVNTDVAELQLQMITEPLHHCTKIAS